MSRRDSDNIAAQDLYGGTTDNELADVGNQRYMWKGVNEETTPMNPQSSTMSLPFADALAQSLVPKAAVSYLRVSTRDQAYRGGEAEGFSIPAQREANRRKAASLGAIIVKEFVDRGASAKSVNRPELQRMLDWLSENQADYVIVHKIDRLARNREDDVEINKALSRAGVRLVSTTEAIDESPSGMLLHGIMSSIAEFYSRNLANEVVKGMSQKIRNGGTVSKVPLGYRNIRTSDSEGREVRTVIVDEERAPLIRQAFELYSTGDWTVATLAEHLADRGLTTVATPKLPSKLIDGNRLNKLLVNPYYKGLVTFQGALHPGKHEPLVDERTWQRVQDVLASHVYGERNRKHPHFLKGTVYCGTCGSRLGVHMAGSRSGEIYPYFVCLGRQRDRGSCTQKAVLIYEVEQQIEAYYSRVALKPDFRAAVEKMLAEELQTAQLDAETERRALNRRRETLERERLKLMEAHYAGAIPLDLLTSEQERLRSGLAEVTAKLDASNVRFETIEQNLSMALDLARDCGSAYRSAPDSIKKRFNSVFFKRVLVHADSTVDPELAPPFETLLGAELKSAVNADFAKNAKKPTPESGLLAKPSPNRCTPRSLASLLAQGSVKTLLVEPRGIEPLTSWLPAKRSPS